MSIKKLIASAAILTAGFGASAPAYAGLNPYLGELMINGYNFCPRGTVHAGGQLLPIAQNTALFSLYGTQFGGDGRTTFGMPQMNNNAPLHAGTGAGLSPRIVGQKGGTSTNVMTQAQLPQHTHQAGVQTTGRAANSRNPKSDAFGIADANTYVNGTAPNQNFMNGSTVTIGNRGGSQPQNNNQPYITMRYCVYTTGSYPPRS